jgi:hypothetical protein
LASKSSASKLAEFLARGIVTRDEAVLQLVLEACHESPAVMVPDLPGDLVASLRGYCAEPPVSPDQAPEIGGVCGGLPPYNDPTSWRKLASRDWFEGMVRWHDYFQSIPR